MHSLQLWLAMAGSLVAPIIAIPMNAQLPEHLGHMARAHALVRRGGDSTLITLVTTTTIDVTEVIFADESGIATSTSFQTAGSVAATSTTASDSTTVSVPTTLATVASSSSAPGPATTSAPVLVDLPSSSTTSMITSSTSSTLSESTVTTTAIVVPVAATPAPVVPAPVIPAAISANSASGSFSGKITFYNGYNAYGACGTTIDDSAMTVALNAEQFDPHTPNGNPNKNTLCNQKIQVTGPNGNSIILTINDRCPGCAKSSLDLTPTAFNMLADPSKGVVPIKWSYM